MKRLFICLIVILNFIFVYNVKALDTSLKIYDYADKLTDEEEKLLKEKIDTFIDTYHMDMVLVSVESHDKYSTMDYADDFYDYNNFGIGSTHDGIIFVLDYKFGKEDMWISTTGEAIRVYDDNRIDRILDVVYEDYDYYKLYSDFIDECSRYASYGIPSSNKNTYINKKGDLVYKRQFPYLISISMSALISTIVLLVLIHKNKMVKKATEANLYMDKNGATITNRNNQFITTHTTSTRINTNSGSSRSGGRVGGSSTHHSSSGRSHGGGGRSR